MSTETPTGWDPALEPGSHAGKCHAGNGCQCGNTHRPSRRLAPTPADVTDAEVAEFLRMWGRNPEALARIAVLGDKSQRWWAHRCEDASKQRDEARRERDQLRDRVETALR